MTDISVREGSFSLLAPDVDKGQADSVTKIEWCLTPKLVDELRERVYPNPHIVIDVCYPHTYRDPWEGGDNDADNQRESQLMPVSRLVLPLARGAEYIQFPRPGNATVIAHIIDIPLDRKEAGRIYRKLYENARQFPNTFRPFSEVSADTWDCTLKYLGVSFTLEVTVPAEFFAKEPPAWTKRLVAYAMGNSKWVDQCDFRGMFLASLFFGTLKLIIKTIVTTVVLLVGLLLGVRNMDWSEARLFSGSVGEIWPGRYRFYTFWTHRRSTDSTGISTYSRRAVPFWIMYPPLMMVVPVLVFWAINVEWHHGSGANKTTRQLADWGLVKTSLITWAGMAVLAMVVGIAVVTIGKIASMKSSKREVSQPKMLLNETERSSLRLQALVCGPSGRHGRNSVRLRAEAVKAKVCKPFPR